MIGFAIAVAALIVERAASEDALCGRYETHTNWPYMINNNAWGLDDSGSICTYVCDTCSDIAFYSLWNWASEPPHVHAYPNVELKSDRLPLKLEQLASLYVSASWSFAPSSLPAGASQDPNTEQVASAITSNDVQANVVLDVFADADKNRSQTPSKQTYELMVWVGVFGDSAWPIGMNAPRDPPVIVMLDDTEFTLYNGTNSRGQFVYSWVTNQTLTTFELDVAPLFGYLWENEGVPGDVYLGVVQFGTEAFYSKNQMNFSVSSYEAQIQRTLPDAAGTGEPTATLPVGTAISGASMVLASDSMFGWLSLILAAFLAGGVLML
ncbi:putative glycoside hydrolase family 12, glycoside hydrolase family 11/12 [Septoria linicola]|nr:putative glycoside hydrolase family 12, glycoside hydrolase family 11/12 [Septoria linicola]